MLCILNNCTDPYLNIATDEYIFKHLEEDCFMLWRNDNAIIVGKHQNTHAEINHEYVKQQNIHVVRRLSGGGAVYHDMGNLNFTFTQTGEDSTLMDFEKFTRPILEVLHSLGVNARFEGRNDLTIDGKKISGNAEHIFKNKILHHGTLLFSSEMRNVSEALKINPLKYIDKAVKSVPKRVTNISEHLATPISIDQFTSMIMDHVLKTFPGARPYVFSEADKEKIAGIAKNKYATREWNFGYSPDYAFKKGIRTSGGTMEINLDVEKGMIRDIRIFGDFFNHRDIGEIETSLRGVAHDENEIRQVLSQFNLDEYFRGFTIDDITTTMF